MHIALIASDHPYPRRLKHALQAAGHLITEHLITGHLITGHLITEPPSPRADHILVDGRSLIDFAGELEPLTALVYHPDAHAKERLRRVHRVIAASQPVADRLVAEYGVERARISVVVPGVTPGRRAPGNAQGCQILSVGALVPRKGHDVLLRALGRLFDLDWQLTIVGSATRDRGYADALVEQALYKNETAPGLAGRVRFVDTGADDNALERLWQASDIFALATHWEGYGMAIADALARGLPVAITVGGEAGALVPPAAGITCPPGDHEGLSKALRRLIFDTRLRTEMREAAWAVGQTLPTWRMQAEALLAALA